MTTPTILSPEFAAQVGAEITRLKAIEDKSYRRWKLILEKSGPVSEYDEAQKQWCQVRSTIEKLKGLLRV